MGCMQSAKCNIKLNKLNQGNIPEAFGRYNISDKKLVKIYQKYCQQNGVIVRDIAAADEQSASHISNIIIKDDVIKRKQQNNNAAPSLSSNYAFHSDCSQLKSEDKSIISLNNINIESIRKINHNSFPSRSAPNSNQQSQMKINHSNVAPKDSQIYEFHENPKIIRNLHLNKLFLKRKIQVHNNRSYNEQNSA